MLDQNEFMRQMTELVDLARANEGSITAREVAEFCSDMGLTDDQLTLVYDFLRERRIEVVGHKGKKRDKQADFSASEGSLSSIGGEEWELNTEDSRYLHLYRRELRGWSELTPEEREGLYARLLDGDEDAVNLVIESHLKRVVTLAGKYRNRGVPLEDLIQEGNLALILAADTIRGNRDITDVRKELDRSVRARLIELADSQVESRGLENTIVARTNLIHEATKALAEEWGRLATVAELAEYTRMTEEEVQMYVDLSLDEIKVG